MTRQTPFSSIIDYIEMHSGQNPERTAIVCGEQTVSYGELSTGSARCRGALHALGISPGERVAMVMSDGPEWITAFLGIIGLGAIAVPCSTMPRVPDLIYILNDCSAKAAIISPEQYEPIIAARPHTPALQTILVAGNEESPDEDKLIGFEKFVRQASPAPISGFDAETQAFILYTSGSTGQPKGAVHCHGDIPFTIEQCGRALYQVKPGDRLFSSSRLFFAYGLGNSFSLPLGLGATSILCRDRPTPAIIAQIMEVDRPTIFFAVPAVFRALLEYCRQGNQLETSSIRFCVSAGESLPARIFHEWKELTGLTIIDAIGSTELLYMFISNRQDNLRPGSSGLPIEGYQVRLQDEHENVITGAGRGNLYIKGASALPCYWNKPEKTAETICDGWVKTGDLYRRDEEGFYWFEGRSDDLFKSSGMWVSPGEVEEALCTHSAVLEAGVVCEPGQDGTNSVVAYVVLRPGEISGVEITDSLKIHATGLLPRYKQPQRIYFLNQLPRTVTGKLQRFKLRDRTQMSE